VKSPKIRLDQLLVDRGLCDSRSKAQALILAGKVRTGTTILDKPGKSYPNDTPLELEAPPKYASRGADKLEGYFREFPITIEGTHILDLGASTGGFTDFLLQEGALSATCVDSGQGQLHGKLRDDPRVSNFENTKAHDLQIGDLPRTDYDIVVLDLSFISLKKVLPFGWLFLKDGGHLVALVKPQFEATKKEADKGRGVIKDMKIHERILKEMEEFVESELEDSSIIGCIPSPIKGAKGGNQEYLLGVQKIAGAT